MVGHGEVQALRVERKAVKGLGQRQELTDFDVVHVDFSTDHAMKQGAGQGNYPSSGDERSFHNRHLSNGS